ncbi:MAG: glycosyltransferase [Clostridium sp.]|nr:glycosyltransferase [Clostridium sp.]
MKIGITSLNLEQMSASAYYNSQENGLGAALSSLGHIVTVYHFVAAQDIQHADSATTNSSSAQDSAAGSCLEQHPAENLTLKYIPCRHIGLHAFPPDSVWEEDTDCFLPFSDHYAGFPILYRFCQKRGILCLPYLGVIASNNPSPIKRLLSGILSRNMRYYRRLPALLAKTPHLTAQLSALGMKQVHTIPVCLDDTKLFHNYQNASKAALLQRYGFDPADRVILFIGRLVPEKQPLLMLQIFTALAGQGTYKLLMLGQGPLKDEVDAYLHEHALSHSVRLLPALENSRMWELYCMSMCYVNLNDHEIFGMSILEALYYECPVIALHAPGPDSILNTCPGGSLCSSSQELLEAITASDTITADQKRAAHHAIVSQYLWSHSAAAILDVIDSLRKEN